MPGNTSSTAQASIVKYATEVLPVKRAAEEAKNAQKNAIENAQKSLDAAVKSKAKALQELNIAEGIESALSKQLAEFKISNPVGYAELLPKYTAAQADVAKKTKAYNAAALKVDAAQLALTEISKVGYSSYQQYKLANPEKPKPATGSRPPTIPGAAGGNGKLPPTKASAGPYIYNAPMVTSGYFPAESLESSILDSKYVLPGNYKDAREAWTNATPSGRGTFQMDEQTSIAAATALMPKNISSTGVADTTKYGFKFLYNPNTVQMSWGSIMQVDPVFEASGNDQFIPGTANLTSSTIDFSLVLNRIQDFTVLGPNGLLPGIDKKTYGTFNLKKGGSRTAEFKEIYEKGTMYDIEYLFRVMHGNGAYVSYKSMLQNGTTADPGWLPVRPIELHLGNKLRYRVRINSLSVSHTIFNPRMIPILSTVTLSCVRYWDGGGPANAVIGGLK
jgi:hypothetical protein